MSAHEHDKDCAGCHALMLLARAESAEAALAGLREGIEALIKRDDARADHQTRLVTTIALRALLVPAPDREEARDE